MASNETEKDTINTENVFFEKKLVTGLIRGTKDSLNMEKFAFGLSVYVTRICIWEYFSEFHVVVVVGKQKLFIEQKKIMWRKFIRQASLLCKAVQDKDHFELFLMNFDTIFPSKMNHVV